MTKFQTSDIAGFRGETAPANLKIGAILADALRRPLFLLAILYSIAITNERAVDIEIFKPYRLVGMLLLIGALLTTRFRVDRLARIMFWFLAVGILAGLPTFFSSDDDEGLLLNIVLLWTFNLATYLAILNIISSRRDVLVLAIVHSLAMVAAAYEIAIDSSFVEFGLVGREFGDFKNPANAGMSMLFASLTLVSVLRSPWTKRWLPRPVAGLVMTAVLIFFLYTSSLTGSRSGVGLMLAGVLCYVFMISKYGRAILLAIALILPIAFISESFTLIEESVANLSDSNILMARIEKKGLDTDRLYLWRSGWDALTSTYGLGVGLAGYPEVHQEFFAPYAHLSDPRWLDSKLTLHNDYVSALVEHGIIGFAIFLVLCRWLYLTASSSVDSTVRAISLSVLLGTAINGLTHTGLPYFCVWFYFALLVAWRTAEQQSFQFSLGGGTHWQSNLR